MNVTICICTRNRPDDLAKCLESIAASSIPVNEIVVSDDSTDSRTRDLAATMPSVEYVEGPRKGLGPNRNAALSAATGDWILFLDDDARLGQDFLAVMAPVLDAHAGENVIAGGIERQLSGLVYPNDQTFLGFQERPYGSEAAINTLVINAALFPRSLFARTRFDPRLIYGYDEVDIAAQARRLGYKILLIADAINWHFPSPVNRGFYSPHTEAARIYVTFKRYLAAERRPLKALLFLGASLAHSLAHQLKRNGLSGVGSALGLHAAAWRNIARWRLETGAGRES